MKQQPKIDLHCHLDGSLNVALVRRFLQEEGEEHACAELEAQMRAPADCPSLADYLARFALPIRCLQTRAHLCAAAETLAADAAAEGVVYLEVLTNLERIADHCSNIAARVIGNENEVGQFDPHEMRRKLHEGYVEDYNERLKSYQLKYLSLIQANE